MKLKNFLVILVFLLIFSIGAVSAAEVNSTDADLANADLSVNTLSSADETAIGDSQTTNNDVVITKNDTTNTYTIITNKERFPSMISCKDMTTTAIEPKVDGYKGQYFTMTVTDIFGTKLANKKVQIGFNGVTYNRITDSNGQAKIQINLAKPDTYTFAVCFLGDDDYYGSFNVAKVIVKKQTPKFTVDKKTYKASAKTKKLTVTLKTSRGKALSGKKITFKVNGKTYTAKTDKKGVATIKVNIKKKKTYTITATYAGDKTYNSVTKSAKLIIK
ncbi:MAG: Ig-like domain repeat protein [Methanobrevibacter sp.]|uniref:Ig-like domain-containing protein n=1 Tax=Methanobrevibacter sp. TaxID=66852 RepID=UPI0025D31A27|nr:Ig-like domain-containing protein [Methanobrevibacter sp.]MBQ6098329.1 Ig-like domain repeat protein [Methanobrevibacter sp.]